MPGYRASDEDLALAPLNHALNDRLDQYQRTDDIGVDHVEPLVGSLIKEAMTKTMTRICDEHVDGTVSHPVEELVDTLLGREIGLDFLDVDTKALQRRSGLCERRVRRDDQVVTVVTRKLCNLEP